MSKAKPKLTSDTHRAQLKRYQEILADYTDKRTIDKVAEEIGVSRVTLWEWRQQPGFWDEVERIRKDGTDQEMTRVWSALLGECKRGNVGAMQLLFKLRGELVDKSEHTFDGPVPSVTLAFTEVRTPEEAKRFSTDDED